jgi:glyceraldehyde-3-phosphate dehydrogenase (NAD(P))
MIKVGINGYGTVGNRVADAVSRQDDMVVLGVTKTRPNYMATVAEAKMYPLYAAIPDKLKDFREKGIKVMGDLNDLVKKCDVVVDASPGKMGASNKPLYEKAGVKAIFQGGEKADVGQASFNSLANYGGCYGEDYVRVVSCNTTGLARVMSSVMKVSDIGKIRAVLVRRAADPGQSKKGPINAIEPVTKVPSHHGPDLKTVIKGIDISTMAVKVPTTLMHLHTIMIELRDSGVTADDIVAMFKKTPRIRLVNSEDGITSTAEVMEFAKHLGRERGDMYENCIWEDSVSVSDGELYVVQAIHQESDIIPENIDCIRAMCELEKSNMKSIRKTDKAMGI